MLFVERAVERVLGPYPATAASDAQAKCKVRAPAGEVGAGIVAGAGTGARRPLESEGAPHLRQLIRQVGARHVAVILVAVIHLPTGAHRCSRRAGQHTGSAQAARRTLSKMAGRRKSRDIFEYVAKGEEAPRSSQPRGLRLGCGSVAALTRGLGQLCEQALVLRPGADHNPQQLSSHCVLQSNRVLGALSLQSLTSDCRATVGLAS